MGKELLFYSLQDKSLKNIIINLLSINWPQSTNELHQAIQSQCKLNISYQAVHKVVKQLQENSCVLRIDKKYKINEEWIEDLSRIIRQIGASQQGKFRISKTLFNKEKNKFNVIIAKDNILRDKLHEQALVSYLRELIEIYQEQLNPHNIFQKPVEEVLQYLLSIQKEHEFFIALIDNRVVGGTVLEQKDESSKEDHKIWKLKHFALKNGLDEEIEREIVLEIEQRLKNKSKSVKIQLNLSEKEKRYIDLFHKYGFKKEGTLEDHYRVGEKMFIYSKLIQ